MQDKQTLAMYIRLSNEDDDLKFSEKLESNSILNQRKLLKNHYDTCLDLKKYDVIEFCDDGYTGTNFDRPGFKQMMEQVRCRKVNCIMVKDLSRLGRDYLEVGYYLELILPLFGIRFISVNDNFDSDNYEGTTGGVELALRNIINGLYSKDLSIKVKSAIQTRNRRGDYCGGTAFYGYCLDPKNKHKIIVDNFTKHVVERIFDESINGLSSTQIAKRLNDDQIPSPAAYKKMKGEYYNGRIVEKMSVWMPSTVLRILKDERYTGKMISNKRETVEINTNKTRTNPKEKWIVVEGTHEPIISQEKFELAAKSLRKRIRTVNQNTGGDRTKNLFVCGHCGRKLQKSYGVITHLFCEKSSVVTDAPCSAIHVPIDFLQSKVLDLLKNMSLILVEQESKIKTKADYEYKKIQKDITDLQRRIQKIQNGKLDLYEEYRQGIITRDTFIQIQERRQIETDELNGLLAHLKEQYNANKTKITSIENVSSVVKEISILTVYNPDIIRKFVREIRVYENERIEIDLLSNDDFIINILNQVTKVAV